MAKVYTETRTAADDLAITFEVNGESATLYIPQSQLSSLEAKSMAEALSDPVTCSLCCGRKAGFALCMARCLYGDGKCCDNGATNCS